MGQCCAVSANRGERCFKDARVVVGQGLAVCMAHHRHGWMPMELGGEVHQRRPGIAERMKAIADDPDLRPHRKNPIKTP